MPVYLNSSLFYSHQENLSNIASLAAAHFDALLYAAVKLSSLTKFSRDDLTVFNGF